MEVYFGNRLPHNEAMNRLQSNKNQQLGLRREPKRQRRTMKMSTTMTIDVNADGPGSIPRIKLLLIGDGLKSVWLSEPTDTGKKPPSRL
jgi:hypothetical protein